MIEMREVLVFNIATSIWEDDFDGSDHDEKATAVEGGGGYGEEEPGPLLNVDEYTALYRKNTTDAYDSNQDGDNDTNNALFGRSGEL